jgi:SAM domain (Sterile alpha motif)
MSASEARFGDDMLPLEWLQEIGLEQYVECFQVNFTIGGSYLSRKLLATVRLQDFSKMNIQIFEHQKLLLRHIEHSLQYSFNDPNRKRELSEIMKNDEGCVRV